MNQDYLAICIPQRELGKRADARNQEIKRALKIGADYIFMMDADQAIPLSAFAELRDAVVIDGYDAALIDAPSKGRDDSNITYHPDGTLAWSGLSCIFYKAEVFKKISPPWFRDDYTYTFEIKQGKYVFKKVDKYQPDNVGEDVNFWFKMIKARLKIYIVPGKRCIHKEI